MMTPEDRHGLKNNKDADASADREEQSFQYGKQMFSRGVEHFNSMK